MKEFINKFKQLDRTKKIVIIFITISFVFILGLTCYNGITGNFENENNQPVVNVNDSKDQKEKDSKTQESQNQDSQENNENRQDSQDNQQEQTEDNQLTEDNKKNHQKNQEPTNQQSSSQGNTTQGENSSQSNTSSSSTENANSSSSSSNPPAKETISIHVQVIGMGDTMMSGNLTVEKGSNAYSVLKELASRNGKTVSGSNTYVTGIGGLNEKEHGPGSGWMYKVNGYTPPKPAIAYTLNNGDSVVWYYVNYQ